MQSIIPLNSVRFKNKKVLKHLDDWLLKLSAFYTFDNGMEFIIWTNPNDNDFMALEAKNYMLGFHSFDYKPSAFISSDVNRCDTDFFHLSDYIDSLL